MKSTSVFAAVLATATIFTACKSNGEKKTETTTVTEVKEETVVKKAREGNKTVIETEKVPAPVVTTFNNNGKEATEIKWSRYEPVPADNWDAGKEYYFVTYRVKNVPYEAWYINDGAVISNEPVINLANSADLPKPVQLAILQNYPGYEIVETDKENDKDMEMWEVELKKGEEKAKVKFLPDGKIFKMK